MKMISRIMAQQLGRALVDRTAGVSRATRIVGLVLALRIIHGESLPPWDVIKWVWNHERSR